MKALYFSLESDILSADKNLWVPAGIFPVVRIFDERRIIINLGTYNTRLITLIPRESGTLILAEDDKYYDNSQYDEIENNVTEAIEAEKQRQATIG